MSRSIVIVDDNPDARETLELILGTLEIPIHEAKDGVEALNIIKKHTPLLVVLDLEMPNVDGKAVRRALLDDPTTREIPILVFTAHHITPQLAEELHVEPDFLLQKGRVSMTTIRRRVIEIVSDAIKIDLSHFK